MTDRAQAAEEPRAARVLIPRGGAWGERVRAMLAERGAVGEIVPVIEARPPRDTAARDRAFASIAAGEVDWLFVTSAASVEQLLGAGVRIPASTRVAAVGRSTAAALEAAGHPADLVPTGNASAATMIAQWCAANAARDAGRCLVLRSDLATATVSDELELRGADVRVAVAYRTVGVDLPTDAIARLRERRDAGFDAVLLTSLSVARELRRQVGELDPAILVASIGPGTTHDAERLGIAVAVTAPQQHIESLVDALGSVISASNAPGAPGAPAAAPDRIQTDPTASEPPR